MHFALRASYEIAALAARGLARIAPHSENKILESLAERRGVLTRYAAFKRESGKLIWMHAPSVGEGLQARPILELLRQRDPDVQRAYSYFSPSARNFARALDVAFCDVLPFDETGSVRGALKSLAPNALVFSKADVWPTLAREASRRGTRLGLVSATLAAGSSRRKGIAIALLRDAYARLDRVGAISLEDADRLVALGVPPSRVSVTGDTRYDQVWARAHAKPHDAGVLEFLKSDRPTLLAGSTWPADESVLLATWARMHGRAKHLRLIIAPHEPTAAHLAPIEAWANGSGLSISRLSGAAATDADVVLVDRTGVLGDLYALADTAFVGGGFHPAGLHSVLEPAAFGVPVLFGPQHRNSRDAKLLLDDEAAIAVDAPADLERALENWLVSDSEARNQAGAAALAVVRRGLGAAERSYALVKELLG